MTSRAETDFYEVLGVTATADAAQIKAAYRRLVRVHHPDANPTCRAESEERMKRLAEAYATLGDAQKRERWELEVRVRTMSERSERSDSVEEPTGSSGGLITRVRLSLSLSSPEFAGRLGLSDTVLQEMEKRDAIPTTPVQLRTLVHLCEQAAQDLESRGQRMSADDLRQSLQRKRTQRAVMR